VGIPVDQSHHVGLLYTMTLSEVNDLIRPATGGASGTWADFGLGRGLFSLALLEILSDRGSASTGRSSPTRSTPCASPPSCWQGSRSTCDRARALS